MIGAKLEGKAKQSPGPGNYNPEGLFVHKTEAKFSVGKEKRHLLKELNKFPGPGQHDDKSQLAGPKFGVGSSIRAPLKPSGEPGPGHYDHVVQVGNDNDFNMQNSNYK